MRAAAAVAAALAACALLLNPARQRANGEPLTDRRQPCRRRRGEGAARAFAADAVRFRRRRRPGDDGCGRRSRRPDEGVPPEGLDGGDELEAPAWTPLRGANFPRAGAPGLAVAVVDAGGVRYLHTFGDCPDADAPFVVGSLSKSFTAVAVMQLVEQGAVDLDAPASRYAPGYDVPDEVTVRSLLNQTSGFGAYDSSPMPRWATLGTFSYANANYDLLGRVIEGASGETYAALPTSTCWVRSA